MRHPILYTFRRCPYAIRARMTLAYAGIQVVQHEVDLKNKPEALLNLSAKGTVPVLVLDDGSVIQESLDIMLWALKQSDPKDWYRVDLQQKAFALIDINDNQFKPVLDRYKYSPQAEPHVREYYRNKAGFYLNELNNLLIKQQYLLSDQMTFVDIAIVPFIRQFYMVDVEWFRRSGYVRLYKWLDSFLNSYLFMQIMKKA